MKHTHTSGKRKEAIARATIKKGSGKVRINKKLLETIKPEPIRLKIKEPLMLASKLGSKIDVDVTVIGGGQTSQADAARLAIARGMVEFSKDKKIEKTFLSYDRNMLVADVRRKEVNKPNRSKARAKRQKSYR
ncbi:MAG: 30S ribosomal protein S9 [Candidatus Woesearchaeota archaeon]|nr:30S ribosomal protein S9 [Candidatus Woesearchaeota archaeon]